LFLVIAKEWETDEQRDGKRERERKRERKRLRDRQADSSTEAQSGRRRRSSDTDVDSLKVVGVHDCSLVELDLCEVSLEQTFQLQARLFPDTTFINPPKHTLTQCLQIVF